MPNKVEPTVVDPEKIGIWVTFPVKELMVGGRLDPYKVGTLDLSRPQKIRCMEGDFSIQVYVDPKKLMELINDDK